MQPFILPPPPSTQFPVPTTFGGGSPGSVRQTTLPLNSTMNQLPLSNTTPPTNTLSNLLGDLSLNLNPSLSMQQPKPVGVLGQISAPATTTVPPNWGAFQSDPLAVLDNLYVPKENIQPGL